jgi:small basic protein (TIGR04137 family)
MTMHRSLRKSDSLARHRNVLSRVERIEKLEDKQKWEPEDNSVFGLPKVRSIKAVRKKKKKEEEEAAPAAGAEVPAAADEEPTA